MQAAQLRPWLPGTSASGMMKGIAVLFGAPALGGFVPLTLLQASLNGARGGHLPSLLLQWAVTTPLGALALMAPCLLVVGLPIVLVSARQRGREVAQAINIASMPPAMWHAAWPTL